MITLEQWVAIAKAELDIDLDVDIAELLDMTKVVAHKVARPAAPLTAFLVGYAAAPASGWWASSGRGGQRQGGRPGRTPGGAGRLRLAFRILREHAASVDILRRERDEVVLPQRPVQRDQAACLTQPAALDGVAHTACVREARLFHPAREVLRERLTRGVVESETLRFHYEVGDLHQLPVVVILERDVVGHTRTRGPGFTEKNVAIRSG